MSIGSSHLCLVDTRLDNGSVCFDCFLNDFYSVTYYSVKKFTKKLFIKASNENLV